MSQLRVPYTADNIANAEQDARTQAKTIADGLHEQGMQETGIENKEIVALIAYLQHLKYYGQ